jgi:hypothetical protein
LLPEQPVQVHDGEPELGLVDEGNRVPEAERLKRAFGEIGPARRFDRKSRRILVPFPDSFPRFAPFFGRRVLSGNDVKLTIWYKG